MLEDILSTHLLNTSQKSESSQKRDTNIKWIIDLPRRGLTYGKKTKQIQITTTQNNEKILIQYPGKESLVNRKTVRPWDFFPRTRRGRNYGDDLNFQRIWDILYEGLTTLLKDNLNWANVLSIIFYRMAFMADHVYTNGPIKKHIYMITYSNKEKEIVTGDEIKKFPPFYQYSPNMSLIKMVSDIVPSWGEMSFEAFLHYNDLLAWNEDCKYFYRAQEEKSGVWIRETGRINTLLSHLSIIGYVSGKIGFSDICMKFSRGKGVAPVTREEIFRLCEGYILK